MREDFIDLISGTMLGTGDMHMAWKLVCIQLIFFHRCVFCGDKYKH